jgi:8-oxo-dGTP diphosphatase
MQSASRSLVLVVAAALIDPAGRVLIAQRPAHKQLGGLWEFPGGKVEPGESPEEALVRELREELDIGVDAAALQPGAFASHAYERFHLLMPLYLCRDWTGEPRPVEAQALAWAAPRELSAYPMPPADAPLLADLIAREPLA